MHQSGTLSDAQVMSFAEARKFHETAIALSLPCDLPIGHVEQVIAHNHVDQLFDLLKAIDLSWETARAILLMQAPARTDHRAELEAKGERFTRLQPETARAAFQYYRLRARAATPVAN